MRSTIHVSCWWGACRSHCLRCFLRPRWPACNGGLMYSLPDEDERKSLMNIHAQLRWLLSLGMLLALLLSAYDGSTASAPIKVGSKDFTEEFIVSELYAPVLENEGFTVECK